MAGHKDKLIAAAQRLVEKGQFEKAVKEYLRAVAEDPEDVRLLLKIGDLYAKLGKHREAIETYQRVARSYSGSGHYLKAIAVYKQIARLEPRMVEINLHLAQLYKQLGLLSDAMQQFELVAAHYHREGKSREALDALKQIVELDPTNVGSRIKLAELYSKENLVREAADEFSRAAEDLHQRERFDDYLKVAERLLFHVPENRPVGREVARLYIQRGDPRRALVRLQAVLKAEPRDIEALELLAQAFEALGEGSKVASVRGELTRMANEMSAVASTRREAARTHNVRPAGVAAPAPEMVSPVDAMGSSPPAVPQVGPSFLETAEEESTITEDTNDEEIGRVLSEVDVYAKYQLYPKAIDHIQKLLLRAPNHIEAREKLKQLYLLAGQPEQAIAELLVLAERMRGPDREGYAQEVLQLDPSNERAQALLGSREGSSSGVRGRGGPVALHTVVDVPTASDVVELDAVDVLEVEEFAVEEVISLDEEVLVEEVEPSVIAAIPMIVEEPEPVETAQAAPASGDYVDPFAEESFADVAEPTPAQESDPLATAASEPLIDTPTLPHAVALPAGNLEDELDEADFFIQQQLWSDAREILVQLTQSHPNHPLVEAKLSELAALEHARGAPLELPEAPPVDPNDDLARLGQRPAAPAIAPPETAPMPRTPTVRVVIPDDETSSSENAVAQFEAHYDLGIAYKEMGLLDEAIAEFNIAMQDPQRQVLCHMMIGLCYLNKGLMADAIAQFKGGLYAERIQERERLALYFELGQVYEQLADVREALYYYEKVAKRDPHFRDVDQRILALGGNLVTAGSDAEEGGEPVGGPRPVRN